MAATAVEERRQAGDGEDGWAGREGEAAAAVAVAHIAAARPEPATPTEGHHRIVVVGGGAGGLVLATKLGDTVGRRRQALVTLVDASLTHVWKPLLHEVAVGTLDSSKDDVLYLGHARRHRFSFQQGRMEGLDRAAREVLLAPTLDADGREVIPRRRVPYDTLVIAVGGVCNDFGTPGVKEHCMFLDTHAQAERVQRRIFNACLRAQMQGEGRERIDVAIIGAGATGVELAAELHKATRELVAYGLDRIDPERDLTISLIEAGPRVLPALPERLSKATLKELQRLGIRVYTGEQVTEVDEGAVRTATGRVIPAAIKVWSAGVKAPDFLKDLDGLETTRGNQLVVDASLRTTRDGNVYALGDCASCVPEGGDKPAPPRAQAAYQEAMTLAKSLRRRLRDQPSVPFVYKDYGSLVSLSYSSVGSLMGNLLGSVMIEGRIARLTYQSLYKKHQLALHGLTWVALNTLINLLRLRTEPRLKLH